jgi:hypothetical protein
MAWKTSNNRLTLYIIIIVFQLACNAKTNKDSLFQKLPASLTGIDFINTIQESDSTKSFINEFGYMGGGVGIADFNNDGLKDIYFTGNQVSSRLYINKGQNKFEDITDLAGVGTNIWATGISIVDINNDGYDDIYVCSYGEDLLHRAKNLLFINQQNLTFKEQATEYGLADTGYSSQAVFFDYDKDGDLDMYLTNYMLNGPNANSIFPKDKSGRSPAQDKLFRNDIDSAHTGKVLFTDVTLQAGIIDDGFGLGVVSSDFNNDGWPDIYVANDFISNDVLWLNNKNGTFTNSIAQSLRHQSYSSMGADAADINNDGLPDITTLDMLSETNERKKITSSIMNYDRYETERSLNYEPEFVRNMLQLNNGNFTQSSLSSIPFFSEIGQLAGIPATDWSWSVLMADFDNDGWKDMHITNGIGRDFINSDFLEFSGSVFQSTASAEEQRKKIKEKLTELKHITLPNYLYLNNGNLTFTDISKKAGIDELSMSNGAAYADLDNDGDLDLVINNINNKAFIFSNTSIDKNKPTQNHFVGINLLGKTGNKNGFGTKVFVYNNGFVQMQEQNPVRGYFSSVDQKILFGLSDKTTVDSILVQWPDNKIERLRNLRSDSVYIVNYSNAATGPASAEVEINSLFAGANSSTNILYKHTDVSYNDYNIQRLLPQKYSQLGPFITTGDINNDGLEDFFIGGAFNFSGNIFLQQKNGSFKSHPLTNDIKMQEDMDCILFDADGDKDLDLLITYGDKRHPENSPYLQPQLFLNDGKGNFSLSQTAIPSNVNTIAGCVTASDFDNDGDLDIFIGGRVASQYPQPAKSYVLQNNNGVFTDVTSIACPLLQSPGMVTSAVWVDFDNDKQTDLIIAGDWMPIRFFKNNKGRLLEITDSTGLTQMHGMWRSITPVDMDNDGDLDVVAGNIGLNCLYNVSEKEPMELFSADIDGNGFIDPLLCYYIINNDGIRVPAPLVNRRQLAEQAPIIKKKFLLNADYAKATTENIITGKARENMIKLQCNETRTCWLENKGNGKFLKHLLPIEAQFAPVNSILCDDIDNDGILDLLLAGNEYQAEVVTGRYDASYGCFLKGNKDGSFTALLPSKTGFILNGDIKDMAIIKTPKQRLLLAAANNDSLQVFTIK